MTFLFSHIKKHVHLPLYKIISFSLAVIFIIPPNPIVCKASEQIITETIQNTTDTTEKEKLESDIAAESYVLMDVQTKTVLLSKNKDTLYHPASITKLLTTLILLESRQNLEDTFTVDHNAVFGIERDSSHIGMESGEQISYLDALYAILLMSANDVSAAVAIDISGSTSSFADKMNERAKQLGAVSSHFVNPHGLSDENHKVTAYDMALIASEVYRFDIFQKAIATINYTIPETNLKESRGMWNSHKMIYTNSPYYDANTIGGKTGYTTQANHTLVTYAKKGDMTLCAVILNDGKAEKWTDTKKLFEYGFNNYQRTILTPEQTSGKTANIQVNNKLYQVDLNYEGPLMATLPNRYTKELLTSEVIVPSSLPFLENGNRVGEEIFYYNNELVGKVNLLAGNITEQPVVNEIDITKNAPKSFPFLLCGILALLILVILYLLVRRQKNKPKRKAKHIETDAKNYHYQGRNRHNTKK